MRILHYLSNSMTLQLGIKKLNGEVKNYDYDDNDNNNLCINNRNFDDIEYNYNPFGEFLISAIF